MNAENQDSILLLKGAETDRRQFLRMSAVSAVCHLVLFFGFVFLPDLTPARRWSPSVVNVNLVALPSRGKGAFPKPRPQAESRTPEVKKPPVPAAERKPSVPKAKPETEAVSLAPKHEIAPKTSMKKKTFKAEKAIQNALKDVEKRAETTPPDPMAKTLEDLRQKVEEGPPGTGAPEGLGEGEGGNRALDQMDIYKVEIAYVIQQNWAFSEPMVGGRKDLEARLVIKILPEGQIGDLFFETKSGNAYFDDSVYKAVKKSDPLPALPKGYRKPFYMVGLRFTPAGLN